MHPNSKIEGYKTPDPILPYGLTGQAISGMGQRELVKLVGKMEHSIQGQRNEIAGLKREKTMGDYHIRLDPASKQLCTIVLPFGKCEYQAIPMGLCNSPDIFQEKLSELMDGLAFVRTYIDDLLCLTKGTFSDHLERVELVLQRLQKAGLKVNITKSFFARSQLECLV